MSIPTFEVINLTPAIAAEFLAGQAPNLTRADLYAANLTDALGADA